MNNTRKLLIGILSAMTITTLSPATAFATTRVRKITYQYGQSVMSGPALKMRQSVRQIKGKYSRYLRIWAAVMRGFLTMMLKDIFQ